MQVVTLLLPLLLQLGGTGIPQPEGGPRAEEPEADFTADGKPIHPIIIDRFVPPIIGAGPEVLAVDVQSAMHNTAHLPPPVRNGRSLTYRYEDGKFDCSASYMVAGTLDDGTVALRTRSNYGGTHTTLKLLLVRFNWQVIAAGEKPRLVMRLAEVADVDHADRVEVKDHWVEVYPSGRNWPTVVTP